MSERPGTLMPPWPKGVSGNPGGRPRLARAPSAALAELNDTLGASPEEQIKNYKAARGAKWCVADEKACAAFRRDIAEAAYGVASLEATNDRLEGKVPQAMSVKSEATLTIEVIDRAVQLEMLRAARQAASPLLEAELRRKALREVALEAEVVEDETSGSPARDASPDEGD